MNKRMMIIIGSVIIILLIAGYIVYNKIKPKEFDFAGFGKLSGIGAASPDIN